MIKIRIDVKDINYEKCFETLIPQLTADCKTKADPELFDKLIIKLGDDIIPVVEKLLGFVDTDTRDKIIVWLVEDQQETIVSALNKALHDTLGSDAIVIGSLYAEDKPGAKIALHAARVKTDSTKLDESPVLTGIGGGLAKFVFSVTDADTIEKGAVKLLSSDYVKPKIVSALSDSLHKAGLHLTISDIVIQEDSGKGKIPCIMDPEKEEGRLPAAIEDKVIDALVAWLKETK
jgi:hypothetical protein